MPEILIRLSGSGPRSISNKGKTYTRGIIYDVTQAVAGELLALQFREKSCFEVVTPEAKPEPGSVVHKFVEPKADRPGLNYVVRDKTNSFPEKVIPPEKLPACSIIIPFFDKVELTERCLSSIWEATPPAEVEVICVDDGSTEKLDVRDDRVRVVRMRKNSGFVKAVNWGMLQASHEFCFVLNNDVELKPRAIQRMLTVLRRPEVGMVGQTGGLLGPDKAHTKSVSELPADYVSMFCSGFRKSVWLKLHGLDEDFGRGYYEDADFGLRLKKSGYQLRLLKDLCEHQGGATFGRGVETLELLSHNHKVLQRKHHKGTALLVMAAMGVNGGAKVAMKMAQALQDDGWYVDVCCFTSWGRVNPGWDGFGKVTPQTAASEYDIVISTFHTTMPWAAGVKAKHHFALIQSDEPEWGPEKQAKKNFLTSGYKHIIIADHMQKFTEKYGMNIVGQLQNGVDSLAFHPTWMLGRVWDHSLMVVRKGAPVWFAGQEYAEAAIIRLCKEYPDLRVVVLGGNAPNWPCKVEHHKTYDENEIRKLYNSVTCMVIPSLIEGCSLVTLEAMSCGTPVVTTRVGVDYGIDGENVLFVPYRSPEDIVQKVGRLFSDPTLCGRLMRNGLATVAGFTWEQEQQQFLEIINREMKR